MEKYIKKWTEINEPVGKSLGYPDCCIKEFCAQPPELMEQSKPTENDQKRFRAAQINGVFTGFIPCIKHAEQILSREITLESLISADRNSEFRPFPDEMSQGFFIKDL